MSSDREKFEVDKEAAAMSVTVKALMEGTHAMLYA